MKTVKCPQCNMVNWTTLDFCKRCSYDLAPAIQDALAKENLREQMFEGQMSAKRTSRSVTTETAPTSFGAPPDYGYQSNAHQQQQYSGYQSQQTSGWSGQNTHQQTRGNYDSGYGRGDYRRGGETSKKLAISSMIFGIIGLPPISMIGGVFLITILGAFFGSAAAIIGGVLLLALLPMGLITGIMALRKASKAPLKFGGKGFAIAGIVTSSLSLLTIPLVAAIAIPNLIAARRAANEGSAIATVRKIAKAEAGYMTSMRGTCADMQTLVGSGMVEPALSSGEKSGYRFSIVTLPTSGCEIHATPLVAEGVSASGTRSFYLSSEEKWTIRAAANGGAPANSNAPSIDSDF